MKDKILVAALCLCLGLFIRAGLPVQAQSNAVRSLHSGNWSDASTWSTGAIPQAGQAVTIQSGHVVTVNVSNDAVLSSLLVNGKLTFARATNTRLRLGGNLVVAPTGTLDMGTAAIPIIAHTELTFVLTQAQSNAYVGMGSTMVHDAASALATSDIGLWVYGRWDSNGKPLVRTWSKLAADVAKGGNVLLVENNVGDWVVGGKIVLTSTRNPTTYYIQAGTGREITDIYDENEVRTIQSVEVLASGQTRITLDSPVAYAHSGTGVMRGEVALLTRNIVIGTEITGADASAYYADVRTRKFAHTAYQYGSRGDLQYTEIKRMGHYGKQGRYPVHYHRMLESSAGMMARGNAIWETGFRCIDLHISHGVLVEDNICFNSQSSAIFSEADEREDNVPAGYVRGTNQDHAFVHNLVVLTTPLHFNDIGTLPGDPRRMAGFWAGDETQNEAYLGNVVVGGREFADSGGFFFPEVHSHIQSAGQVPWTFVHNEVHSTTIYGIYTWQVVATLRDFVDTLLWRNGDSGIFWGAYLMTNRYFNAQILENGVSGVKATSVNTFVQDSLITGPLTPTSRSNTGFAVQPYVLPEYPALGIWVVRNRFRNLKTSGISQFEMVVPNDNANGEVCPLRDFATGYPLDLKQRPVFPEKCSAVYMTAMGNTFENVPHPMVFGQQPNPNSWWKVFDYNGTQDDFVLVRADQNQPAKQGVITKKLVTPDTVFNAAFNALVIPMASLPVAGIPFTGLLNEQSLDNQNRASNPDFTFATKPDYPPTIAMSVTWQGKVATLSANASDDKAVTRVEFYADYKLVATDTTAPYSASVDLSNWPRKYAYLYARAFDGQHFFAGYEQRAYSNVFEIGPEFLAAKDVALRDSLIAYWKLDEASGNRADSIGGNTLTDINTVGSSAGKLYPLAANFAAASSEKLTRLDNAALSMGDISFWMGAWVNLADKSVLRGIAGKYGSTNIEYLVYYHASTDRFRFVVSPTGAAGAQVTVSAPSAVTPNAWHLVCVWHDAAANTINIQVDNGPVASAPVAQGVKDGAAPFEVGSHYGGNYWQGKIGPLMVGRNYVPTANDRTWLWNNGLGRTMAEMAEGQ